MPPANSPTGTPVQLTPALISTDPYLRQLDAISSPTLNLAATLTTNVAEEDHNQSNMSDLRSTLNQAAPLSRSARLPRQPYLTEDEFREINNERRRRAMDNLNMEQSTDMPSVHSYSNRVPARQSLYDWAAAADESDGEIHPDQRAFFASRFTSGNDSQSINPSWLAPNDRDISMEERRQREREARRNLEPRDEPSGRVRLPPIRNRSPSEEEREEHIARLTASGRSPSVTAALSRLIERQRVERRERRWEREHAVEAPRTEDQSIRATTRARALRELRSRERFAQFMDSRHKLKPPTMPKTVSMIKYLSELRECNKISDALALASSHDISTLYSSQANNSPSDLPLSTEELTPPQHSSFLTPGAVFEGVQRATSDPPVMFLSRDRDYLRRMVANRNLNFSSTNLPGSLTALMDAERYILDFIEDENAETSSNSSARTAIPPPPRQDPSSSSWSAQLHPHRPQGAGRPTSNPRPTSSCSVRDSWPVQVTLHTVSLPMGTLSGTMSASHIPDKVPPGSPDHKPDGSSMESYFEGEIIDFRRFSLETGNERFKSGGAEVDARHWRSVGPLREVAETVRKRRVEDAQANARVHSEGQKTGKDGLTYEDEEELEGEIDEEIQRCLGSKRWLESKFGDQAEWILMRWKERCFLSLPPSTSMSDRYGNPLPGRSITGNRPSHNNSSSAGPHSSATTVTSPHLTGYYGLTISGYYYIALHRMTGRIEGLYFDPGSQPYQELTLLPEGMTSGAKRGSGSDHVNEEEEIDSSLKTKEMDLDADHDAGSDQHVRLGNEVGVRKWFPSVEFR